MALPEIDPSTGSLPPGIHEATWDEFEKTFGSTRRRIDLMGGLRRALDVLAAVGCSRVFINGSFVTNKEEPNDYDGCWDADGVDVDELLRVEPLFLDLHDLQSGRTRQKAKYGGELFAADWNAEPEGTTFLEFFQRDRDDVPKGNRIDSNLKHRQEQHHDHQRSPVPNHQRATQEVRARHRGCARARTAGATASGTSRGDDRKPAGPGGGSSYRDRAVRCAQAGRDRDR